MKLLMFEHCSLCFRVRMVAALKGIPLVEQVVEDDDDAAMVDLVGRRVIPILVRDDGTPMLESWDMVEFIDAMGDPVLTGPERPEIADLAKRILDKTPNLTMPRYAILPLPELRTPAARDHFVLRKHKVFGDFARLRSHTQALLAELMPVLDDLDRAIDAPDAINGTLSRDDVRILPLLRSAAVIDGLRLPDKVDTYFRTMMDRIGHRPLPVI